MPPTAQKLSTSPADLLGIDGVKANSHARDHATDHPSMRQRIVLRELNSRQKSADHYRQAQNRFAADLRLEKHHAKYCVEDNRQRPVLCGGAEREGRFAKILITTRRSM